MFKGEPVAPLLRGVARQEGEFIATRAAELTPKRTGRTADAWRALPVEQIVGGYRSSAENPSYKARFLEGGTRAHEVKPKGKRAVSTPEGARASARIPALPGHHMLARAMAEAEASMPERAQPLLDRFAAECERNGS